MGQPRHQIPVSFYPSNIQAVKTVAEENRGSVFGNPQHRESRRQGSGVEFQEGGERESRLHHLSAAPPPWPSFQGGPELWVAEGEKNNKEGRHFVMEDSSSISQPSSAGSYSHIRKHPIFSKNPKASPPTAYIIWGPSLKQLKE